MKKNKEKNIQKAKISWRFITPIHHFLLVTSSITISMIFIISWVLSISFYKTDIDEFLSLVSVTLQNKGFDYTINFAAFTIVNFIFALFALLIVATPFIFIHKKNFVTLMTTIFSILYAIIVLIAFSGAIYICYDTITDYINKHSNIILLLLLPWCLEAFFALILLISAVWLLITFLYKVKVNESKVTSENSVETPNAVEQQSTTNSQTINENIPAPTPLNNMPANQAPATMVHSQPQPAQSIPSHSQTPIIINNQVPEQSENSRNDRPNSNPIIPEIKIYINNNEKKDGVLSLSPADARNTATNLSQTIPHEQIPITEINSEPIIWSNEEIEQIWNKAEVISGYDYKLYRKDYAGALMFRKAFVNSPTFETEKNPKSYNWTIAIQKPINHGGSLEESNLLAMNTLNFIEKGNHFPHWKTVISYNGRENVIKEKQWRDK